MGVEFAPRHDPGLVRDEDAPPHRDDERQRVLPFPALGQLAADDLGGQIGLGNESLVTTPDRRLVEVADEELLVEHPRVVVLLPVPVRRVPRQRRQGHVDRAHVQFAAVARRLRYDLTRCQAAVPHVRARGRGVTAIRSVEAGGQDDGEDSRKGPPVAAARVRRPATRRRIGVRQLGSHAHRASHPSRPVASGTCRRSCARRFRWAGRAGPQAPAGPTGWR